MDTENSTETTSLEDQNKFQDFLEAQIKDENSTLALHIQFHLRSAITRESERITEAIEKLNESEARYINALDEEKQKYQKDIEDRYNKKSTDFKREIESKNTSELNSKKNDLQKFFDEHKSTYENRINTFITSETQKLNTLRQQISDEVQSTIEKFNAESDELISTYERKFSELENQAQGVLSHVSTAVLTTSFEQEKRARLVGLRFSLGFFAIVIVLMFGVPIGLYFTGNYQFEMWLDKPILFFFSVVKTIALEWPLIWIANILSKKMQLQQRIYEEYAYKYATALSYAAMRSDVKNIGDESTKIAASPELKGFRERLVDAVYINPSHVFEKQFDTGNPLERLAKIIKEIGPDMVKAQCDLLGTKKQ